MTEQQQQTIIRISKNFWQMTSAEKERVIRHGSIDGISLERPHVWSQHSIGWWSFWFL